MKPKRSHHAIDVSRGRPRHKVFEPIIRPRVTLPVPPWLLEKSAPEDLQAQNPGTEPSTEGPEP